MDLWVILLGYLICGIISGFFITKFTYQHSIEINKNPVPKNKIRGAKYSIEELDNLETKRRKKLATEAITTGFWMGTIWIIALPLFIVLMVIGLIMKGFNHFAIKPMDKQFVSDKEFRKAEAVIARYEAEQRNEFQKELDWG